jgi:hypothetical protein
MKIITYNGFLSLIENHYLLDEKNIIDFINSSENVKKYHTHLLKHFSKSLQNKSNTQIQHGGNLGMMFSLSSGIGLFVAVGYLVMYMTSHPHLYSKCKPSYKILKYNEYPTPTELLKKLVPSSWLGNATNINEALFNLTNKLDSIDVLFSVIDTNSSLIKSVGVNLLRVTSSVALDVATLGAGGDEIISFLFMFKSIIDLIRSIVVNIKDIISDNEAIQFLYDILNVNFSGGPFHVKCWIKHILKEYGSNTQTYKTICNFFNTIFDKLANFMGNALGAMIPDSMGLPGIIIPSLIKNFKSGAITQIDSKINKYYEKIPTDIKIMITNPKILKHFLDFQIKRGKKKLMGFGNELAHKLKTYTEPFAHFTHKFFALMFSLFHILKLCLSR